MTSIVASSAPKNHLIQLGERDLFQELLADKKSPNTRRAYAKDLRLFFNAIAGDDPNPDLVAEFLTLDRFSAISLVLKYKAALNEKGLASATINRRLAAIKSLVNYARRVGQCDYSLDDIQSEKIQPYRDTTGINTSSFKAMLAGIDRSTLKGKRDYALLTLLWGNALRRGEVAKADIKDLDLVAGTLKIYGKGKGKEAQIVSLGKGAINALSDWLQLRGNTNRKQPLFCSTHPGYWGKRLSTTSIYKIVRKAAEKAGIDKVISPHRIRHSAITAALDQTDGNVRMVQKLSRHAKFDTLLIYDDNRTNAQKTITNLLDDLI
ncbi:MAG: tyrosine-type recombinase/integrase [Xenococcaceae cyanobacterium MO_234.B1]|nr:tyrosine-type recombinase/integrase [Xenococcaceae cyanobacterium MO_234.B1]